MTASTSWPPSTAAMIRSCPGLKSSRPKCRRSCAIRSIGDDDGIVAPLKTRAQFLPRTPERGLWFYAYKVIVEDRGELLAVSHPMCGRRVILQSSDPVDVEFVHNRVDAIALEPAVAERAAVAERRVGAAFREPRVRAQQLFEDHHAREMAIQLRHRRPADVKTAAAVVVQFDGE